jgi:hypothetical protein
MMAKSVDSVTGESFLMMEISPFYTGESRRKGIPGDNGKDGIGVTRYDNE